MRHTYTYFMCSNKYVQTNTHTHTSPSQWQYLQRPWPRLWVPPWGGVDHFCCPLAWWLCCCQHGPSAPSASAQHFHTSGVWQCHKPRALRLLHGSTWTPWEELNRSLIRVDSFFLLHSLLILVVCHMGLASFEIQGHLINSNNNNNSNWETQEVK